MYELKSCPVCGAAELKKTGTEEHDGQIFGLYQCLSCDAMLSSYEKYLKTVKKKVAAGTEEVKEKTAIDFGAAPQTRTVAVNVAADVYQKAIGSTLALVAVMEDGTASGTGTIVSDSGYFITNAHVVAELSQNRETVLNFSEEVCGQSGEHNYRFLADIIYVNPEMDLALLKTDPSEELGSVTFSAQEPFPGEAIYAIGNSKGEGLCIVEGIISDVHRRIGAIDAIMISAPVTHGNSGGPVFDAEGRLVGIVQSGRKDVSAMNYVIPAKTILAFLQKAKEKEDLEFSLKESK